MFIKYFLELIDFVIKSLKILTSGWYISSNKIEILELQSEYTALLTELSLLEVLKSRDWLKL